MIFLGWRKRIGCSSQLIWLKITKTLQLNQQRVTLFRGMVNDGTQGVVAREKGIALGKDEVVESLLRISRFSDGQLISTLQDIRLGRRTEIGTLDGAIVGIASSLNRGHLVPETRLLGEMTQLKADLSFKPR